ncbi:MAG: hypothetical protein ACRD2C_00200 [Acidimicrobiales bacterium]
MAVRPDRRGWDTWDRWERLTLHDPPDGRRPVRRQAPPRPSRPDGAAYRQPRRPQRPPVRPRGYEDYDHHYDDYGDLHEHRRRARPGNPGLWLIVVGLIALAAAGGAVVGGSRHGADPGASRSNVRSAEQAVIAYFEALGDQDCPTALGLVSELSWQPGGAFASAEEAAAECSSGGLLAQTPALTVEQVDVLSLEPDRITLAVTGLVDGQPLTVQLILVEDGDGWKIQLPDGAAAPGAGSPAAPPADGAVPPADPGLPSPTTPTTTPPPPVTGTDAAAVAVRAFYDAMVAEDCGALVAITTTGFWTSLVAGADPANLADACASAYADGHLTADISVGDVVLDRHQSPVATFSVSLTLGQDGSAYVEMVDAVDEGGVWKISLLY